MQPDTLECMTSVLQLTDVSVVRDGRPILDRVDWTVDETERWVVLGPNGAGKSTLLNVAAAQLHPSSGVVNILGEQLGRSDVFELRPRIGYASSSVGRRIPDSERVIDAVLTASWAVTGRWREVYDDIDERRARRVLREWQLDALADRSYGTLSDGEQKRVLIARAVMSDPELLLLDEPSASLDLGSRENLLASLSAYAKSEFAPAIVLVTHHVEEIPEGISHVLLLRSGRVVAAGPIERVLDAAHLSRAFGMPLIVQSQDGRYSARAAR